uniref:Uncharacterized protein n=1 Tax=Trichogramma kaykai TaxID=54128 RepID=A0ABD2XIQ7_9HYME
MPGRHARRAGEFTAGKHTDRQQSSVRRASKAHRRHRQRYKNTTTTTILPRVYGRVRDKIISEYKGLRENLENVVVISEPVYRCCYCSGRCVADDTIRYNTPPHQQHHHHTPIHRVCGGFFLIKIFDRPDSAIHPLDCSQCSVLYTHLPVCVCEYTRSESSIRESILRAVHDGRRASTIPVHKQRNSAKQSTCKRRRYNATENFCSRRRRRTYTATINSPPANFCTLRAPLCISSTHEKSTYTGAGVYIRRSISDAYKLRCA